MQQIDQSEGTAARRRVYFTAVSSANLQTRQTALTTFTVRVLKPGGTEGAGAGADPTEVDATDMPGVYYYELTAGEVDTIGPMMIRISKTNMETRELPIQVVPVMPTAAVIADAIWDEARSGHTTGGTFGEGVASVQGNVTGSAASVTGNVGGNVTGSVGSIATGGITAASFAADAITAAKIAADVGTEIANAVLAATIHTGWSVARALRIIAAGVAGKRSGTAAHAPVHRFVDDSGDAITGTTNSDNDRLTASYGA